MPHTISIIDIGSNSAKVLVINEFGNLYEDTIGTRLGEGMSQDKYAILPEAMERTIKAVTELREKAKQFNPIKTFIVATQAIREAKNGEEFCDKIKSKIGVEVKTLTGQEEAKYIARGVASDPHLRGHKEFCMFDIGGGSLECVYYKDGDCVSAESFPFGAVRLTEQYISNPKGIVAAAEIKKIMHLIEESLHGFPHRGMPLIGTGGSLATARKALHKEAYLSVSDLKKLQETLCSIDMEERISKYGIPRYRADLMPAALAIALALADKGGAKEIVHSYLNLRFGLAAKLLEEDSDLKL